MDSLHKLSENSDITSIEIKSYWRQIEKLLSRNEFFSKIEEIGLIAIILSKYSQMPPSLRDLELEEAFEKAETKTLELFESMLSQRKLAEDVGFHAEDLSLLLEAFSHSFFGSEHFYSQAQNLAFKFKYTLNDETLLKILHAVVVMKLKTVNMELANLIATIDRSKITSIKLQQYYDYVSLTLKIQVPSQEEQKGYIENRHEINTRVMPKVSSRKSFKVLLKEGETYYYCTCGISK